jgi:hypothetical protein
MANARVVVTDSGGIQEETTALGIPCLTMRRNAERPITITEGTNRSWSRTRRFSIVRYMRPTGGGIGFLNCGTDIPASGLPRIFDVSQ